MTEVGNDRLAVSIDEKGRVRTMRHQTAEMNFLQCGASPVGLWQLGLMRPVTWTDPLPEIEVPDLPYERHEWWINRLEYDADLLLDSNDCEPPTVQTTGRGTSLTWNVPLPDGEVGITVRIWSEDDGLHCDARVSVPETWAIKWFVCPRIRGFGTPGAPGDDALLYPINFGVLRRNPLADMTNITGQYPAATNWCQMAAWLHGDSGVMLSVRDPETHHTGIDAQYVEGDQPAPAKTERWHGDKDTAPWLERRPLPLDKRVQDGLQPAIQIQCRHWPASTHAWAMPYSVRFDALSGGWPEAARRHRSWATGQRWCRRGPLRERTDAPAPLFGLDLWFIRYGFPPGSSKPRPAWEFRDAMLKLREYFGMPFGVHWYHWHAFSWHSTYPTHRPPVEGFEEVVRELQDHGIVIMPYCQGRLLYRDRPQIGEERTHASIEANGQPYLEMYTPQDDWPLALCANDPWSAAQWAEAARMLWQDYGVEGVYFDQITAMPPSLCYHGGHGHSPGGGTHYWKGYDEALAEIQKQRHGDPDRFIASELLADAFLDRIDLYLPFVPPIEDYVPLFPALYGDYTFMMGRSTPGAVMEDPTLMALCQGEQFLFGAQLGWMDESILSHPDAAAYLRDLARLRSRVRDILNTGHFLAPLPAECDPAMVTARIPSSLCGRKQGLVRRRPPVRTTAWEDGNGRRLILALNEASEPVTAAISLPEAWHQSRFSGWFLGESEKQAWPPRKQVELHLAPHAAAALVSPASTGTSEQE